MHIEFLLLNIAFNSLKNPRFIGEKRTCMQIMQLMNKDV